MAESLELNDSLEAEAIAMQAPAMFEATPRDGDAVVDLVREQPCVRSDPDASGQSDFGPVELVGPNGLGGRVGNAERESVLPLLLSLEDLAGRQHLFSKAKDVPAQRVEPEAEDVRPSGAGIGRDADSERQGIVGGVEELREEVGRDSASVLLGLRRNLKEAGRVVGDPLLHFGRLKHRTKLDNALAATVL